MPYIFFNHSGSFFKLSVESGVSHWNRQTLMDFASHCGFQILESINMTLYDCAQNKFCEVAAGTPQWGVDQAPSSYEKLTLMSANQSDCSEWQCINQLASEHECDESKILLDLYLILIGIVLAGLVCLRALKACSRLRGNISVSENRQRIDSEAATTGERQSLVAGGAPPPDYASVAQNVADIPPPAYER